MIFATFMYLLLYRQLSHQQIFIHECFLTNVYNNFYTCMCCYFSTFLHHYLPFTVNINFLHFLVHISFSTFITTSIIFITIIHHHCHFYSFSYLLSPLSSLVSSLLPLHHNVHYCYSFLYTSFCFSLLHLFHYCSPIHYLPSLLLVATANTNPYSYLYTPSAINFITSSQLLCIPLPSLFLVTTASIDPYPYLYTPSAINFFISTPTYTTFITHIYHHSLLPLSTSPISSLPPHALHHHITHHHSHFCYTPTLHRQKKSCEC